MKNALVAGAGVLLVVLLWLLFNLSEIRRPAGPTAGPADPTPVFPPFNPKAGPGEEPGPPPRVVITCPDPPLPPREDPVPTPPKAPRSPAAPTPPVPNPHVPVPLGKKDVVAFAPAALPPVFVKTPVHPDNDLYLALKFLYKVSPDDAPFFRFFSFYAVPDEYLEAFYKNFKVYLNTVNSGPDLAALFEVPGSFGRLYAVDFRRVRWNAEAFSAVARRDRVFTEPNVDSYLAEELRRIAGIQQDPVTFHAEVVVPAPWFTREIGQADRSTSYYDLLYANERFGKDAGNPDVHPQGPLVPVNTPVGADPGPEPVAPASKPWPGGVWPGDGLEYPAGAFSYFPDGNVKAAYDAAHADWLRRKAAFRAAADPPAIAVPLTARPAQKKLVNKVVKDFPATVDDWNDKWGIKAAEDFLKKENLFVAKGEVVAGAKNDARGSYVAYNDRVITFLQVPTGQALRTFDALKTANNKNFANEPRQVAIGDLKFDAGELLVNLPNGLQAALLINGQGKRVEIADSRIARNTLDGFDVTVRTQIGCVTCHGSLGGVIPMSNEKVKDAIRRGNRLLDQDPDRADELNAFFNDFSDQLDFYRSPYRKAVRRLTATAAEPDGWPGPKLVVEGLNFRNWYDAPVTLDQAAAELGFPRLAVALACFLEGSIDAGNLALEYPIPRDVWDEDLFPKLALVLSAARQFERPDPVFAFFFPELLRQTAGRAPDVNGKIPTKPSPKKPQ